MAGKDNADDMDIEGGEAAAARWDQGLSAEQVQLVRAFHHLQMVQNPEDRTDKPSDLLKFVSDIRERESRAERVPDPLVYQDPPHHAGFMGLDRPQRYISTHFPKIGSFGGETKGDVTWECFKYEVESLVEDGEYRPEQILHGIRKAVKGEVAEIVRRLGTRVTIQQILDKLDSTYGNIETRETIMRKLYNCTQQPLETVTSFASRLEDHFDKAVLLGGISKTDDATLKGVLYQGLRKELKHLATYKCETINDYDRFKIELRKIEAEMKDEVEEKKKPCKPAVPTQEKNEMSEMLSLMKQMNERIQKLEEQKGRSPDYQFKPFVSREARRGYPRGNSGYGRGYGDGYGRGYGDNRRGFRSTSNSGGCGDTNQDHGTDRGGHRGTFRGTGRGRGTPSRATPETVCYNCNQRGHYQYDCLN